ncbi:MAG TPA: FAD-dependent oxidoreductase [Flavisolibacter sp.]|nr:FAD-dependent oxidoreductase [Flavisolibacter sp.]
MSLKKKHLVIIGSGFAGFWSAMSAIRQSRYLGKEDQLRITVINKESYLTIRPRLYESDLSNTRYSLRYYYEPAGIHFIQGEVRYVNPDKNELEVVTGEEKQWLQYDYLVLSTGSKVRSTSLQGKAHLFNVDSYNEANRLHLHINKLAGQSFSSPGSGTFVIIGGGFTGLEVATALQDMLRLELNIPKHQYQIVIADRNKAIGTQYGTEGQAYILQVLEDANICVKTDATLQQVDNDSITFTNGDVIRTQTCIWTAGFQPNSLAGLLQVSQNSAGQFRVDSFLKVKNYNNIIAAGDVAIAKADEEHEALMSCQFALYQGRWAGHNAVNDLFNEPLLRYAHENYVTCLDLGSQAALFTVGWSRQVVYKGMDAKKVKLRINEGICPLPTLEENVEASYPQAPSFNNTFLVRC